MWDFGVRVQGSWSRVQGLQKGFGVSGLECRVSGFDFRGFGFGFGIAGTVKGSGFRGTGLEPPPPRFLPRPRREDLAPP